MKMYDTKWQLVYPWLEQSPHRSSAQKIAQAKVNRKLCLGKIDKGKS